MEKEKEKAEVRQRKVEEMEEAYVEAMKALAERKEISEAGEKMGMC
jgi:hypothetical protein